MCMSCQTGGGKYIRTSVRSHTWARTPSSPWAPVPPSIHQTPVPFLAHLLFAGCKRTTVVNGPDGLDELYGFHGSSNEKQKNTNTAFVILLITMHCTSLLGWTTRTSRSCQPQPGQAGGPGNRSPWPFAFLVCSSRTFPDVPDFDSFRHHF